MVTGRRGHRPALTTEGPGPALSCDKSSTSETIMTSVTRSARVKCRKGVFIVCYPIKHFTFTFISTIKNISIDKHTVQCSFEYELSGCEHIMCGPGEYNRLGLARVTLRSRALAGGALNSLKAQVCDQGQGPSLPAHRPCVVTRLSTLCLTQGRLIQGCL